MGFTLSGATDMVMEGMSARGRDLMARCMDADPALWQQMLHATPESRATLLLQRSKRLEEKLRSLVVQEARVARAEPRNLVRPPVV